MTIHYIHRAHRRGFSLVELLVVIGVIAVLIGILVPTVTSVMRKGRRQATVAQLQMIGTALEAYKGDFGDYPRVGDFPAVSADPSDAMVLSGAEVLARALIGPGPAGTGPAVTNATDGEDGADGPVFRIRRNPTINASPQGKTWGPYLPADRFKLRDPDAPNATPVELGRVALVDDQDKPILYMPARAPKPDFRLTTATNFVDYAETALFDANDLVRSVPPANARIFFRWSADASNVRATNRLRVMLGDADANGRINGTEAPATEGPFVLWTAGDDGEFGPLVEGPGDMPTADAIKACDDVANFTFPGRQ